MTSVSCAALEGELIMVACFALWALVQACAQCSETHSCKVWESLSDLHRVQSDPSKESVWLTVTSKPVTRTLAWERSQGCNCHVTWNNHTLERPCNNSGVDNSSLRDRKNCRSSPTASFAAALSYACAASTFGADEDAPQYHLCHPPGPSGPVARRLRQCCACWKTRRHRVGVRCSLACPCLHLW